MNVFAFGRSSVIHTEAIECSECGESVPAGQPVMWDEPSYEYGETDPYCTDCTEKQKAEFEAIDWDAAAREMLGLPEASQ